MIKKIYEKMNLLIDNNIKITFKNILKLKLKYKIIWVSLLPFSFIFLFINFLVIIISLLSYSTIFILKLIKIRIFNKKTKNLIYIKRFKFLKKFYPIIFEKILITYPKQKAFLIFYIIFKSIYEKDKSFFNKSYLPEFLKSLSNRLIILIIFSIPYILIYCNTNLIKIIEDLEGYNYESYKAYLNSILINILKDLTNDYNKLILKLKIKFYKKKIIFNSKKDILNAMKYKKEFYGYFNNNKKNFKYLMIKQKVEKNMLSKEHFTAINKLENGKLICLNETSKININYYKYNKNLEKYIKEIHKNLYMHNGTINEKKETYYTQNILTNKDNILVINNENNIKFLKNIKEEKLNNIMAAFSLNLDKPYWENVFIKTNNIEKNILLENMDLKNTIDFYKENKDSINTEQFESILGMQFFWEENERLISELNFLDKINLCNDLNIEVGSSSKEISFQIFKSIINKK